METIELTKIKIKRDIFAWKIGCIKRDNFVEHFQLNDNYCIKYQSYQQHIYSF